MKSLETMFPEFCAFLAHELLCDVIVAEVEYRASQASEQRTLRAARFAGDSLRLACEAFEGRVTREWTRA